MNAIYILTQRTFKKIVFINIFETILKLMKAKGNNIK